MPYRSDNPSDKWLRNLDTHDTASGSSLSGSPATGDQYFMDGYRVRVMRLMLAIAAVAGAAMWYHDASLDLMSVIDRIGYPVLVTVTSLGALILIVRPGHFQAVINVVFAALVTYLVSNYYWTLFFQGLAADPSSYMLATLALWMPFCYVAAYIFYSPQTAVRTSLGIYAAIFLPHLALLNVDSNTLARQIAVAMLISHPVYIAALWGVAQIKAHARGAHDLARSMSVAATEDPLTGVANRRAMLHALETVVRNLSGSDRPLALLLLDVDCFKEINDTFGHGAGDEVLTSLACHANANLRSRDLLGRWGGEEFMILALDETQTQAMQMAERLRAQLEAVTYPHAGRVTVSIGVTTLIPGESVNTFIKRADDALYQAKGRGRNRVEGLFAREAA